MPKPKQIKSENALKNAVNYILNPMKTNEQVLTSGHVIHNLNAADIEMNYTRILSRKMIGRQKKGVLAHHLVQSFDPKETLSPEQLHEIGREWVESLIGKDHEYIIATHIDKGHVHNHIIFNSTSNVDFKNFRWQRDTLKVARELSDKISAKYGALQQQVNPYEKQNHHHYKKYLEKNPLRPELKQRLLFLLKHSTSIEDFKKKAQRLNIAVDFSGKFTTYQLTDRKQERPIRDSSLLSKVDQKMMQEHPEKRKFSLDEIEKQCEKNQSEKQFVYSESEIFAEYQKQQKWYEENNDIKLIIENWQVDRETEKGIYIHVQAGHRPGTIFLDNRLFDRGENGSFEVYLNAYSRFTFWDDKDVHKTNILYGGQIISQLSDENEYVPIRKNYAMKNVHHLFEAMNFLSKHGVEGKNSFNHLGEEFISEMEKIDQAIEELESKIIAQTAKVKFDQHNEKEIQLLKNLEKEREELEVAYKEITDELEIYDNIQDFKDEQERDQNQEEENQPNAKI